MKKTLLLLLIASISYGGSFFVEPTAALVIPSNSGATYHNMDGHVSYNNGEAFGVNAGRYFGPHFKLYASYTYTEFRAKEITLQTPIGIMSQTDNDLYHSHTTLVNCDYRFYEWEGIQAIAGAGIGANFDQEVSPVYEGHIRLEKRLGKWICSLGYSYRITQGQIRVSNTTNIQEPNTSQITFAVSHRF